jgi:hypothetical protein
VAVRDDPKLHTLREISARADWLTAQGDWTQEIFDELVKAALATGEQDSLEPLFLRVPDEYVGPYLDRTFKRGKPIW